ncbi:hypothetical protein PsorP6_009129 [Peronosclerospora sorghi]|uniref:Uncharacterized protein n=1 Tax=Peronosclerospora sorghi TaxID=230839 RepID=A0ACC0VZB0_9STRA|nr:hypothetical protein PsorP6_009129 [Peronosclerospora sorghi]
MPSLQVRLLPPPREINASGYTSILSAIKYAARLSFLTGIRAMDIGSSCVSVEMPARMAARDREQVLRSFQQQEETEVTSPPLDVLLLSLRTGGLGLNLTMRRTCLPWNRAEPKSGASGGRSCASFRPNIRCTRCPFIIKGSIEEQVVALQDKKRQLTAACLGDGDLLLSA